MKKYFILLHFLLFLFIPTFANAKDISKITRLGHEIIRSFIILEKTFFTIIILISAIYIGYSFFLGNPNKFKLIVIFSFFLICYSTIMIMF